MEIGLNHPWTIMDNMTNRRLYNKFQILAIVIYIAMDVRGMNETERSPYSDRAKIFENITIEQPMEVESRTNSSKIVDSNIVNILQELQTLKDELSKIKGIIIENKNHAVEKVGVETLISTIVGLEGQIESSPAINGTIYVSLDFKTVIEGIKHEINNINRRIKEESDIQKRKKLPYECVEAIKSKNFDLAVQKLNLISDDSKIRIIVNEAYDDQKSNFYLVLQFGDGIKNASQSFMVYKSLYYEMEVNEHLTPKLLVLLAKSLKTNVVQYAAQNIKEDAMSMVHDLESTIKTVTLDLSNGVLSFFDTKTLEPLDIVLSYDSTLYQEVVEKNMNFLYRSYSLGQILYAILHLKLKGESTHIPEWLYAFYKELEKNGQTVINKKNIGFLFNFQHLVLSVKNLNLKNERSICVLTSLSTKLQGLRNKTVEILTSDMLKEGSSGAGIYHSIYFDYSSKFFAEIISEVINNTYGKIRTDDMLKKIHILTSLEERIMAYDLILDKMKESGELEFNIKNHLGILELHIGIEKMRHHFNFNYLEPPYDGMLEKVKNKVPDLEKGSEVIFNSSIQEGSYKGNEMIHLTKKLYDFDKIVFNKSIINFINDVYLKVNTSILIDFIESQEYIEIEIFGFTALQNKLEPNNNYFFGVAYAYKRIKNYPNFSNVIPEIAHQLETFIQKLPTSVKNIVIAKLVCILNADLKEYLYAEGDSLKFDSSKRSVFTWTPGIKLTQGVWEITNGDKTGKFKIRNIAYNEFLHETKSVKYDAERRRVFTRSLAQAIYNEWQFELTENNIYIREDRIKEYLYTGTEKHDDDRRHVFTWIPGGRVSRAVWEIEKCDDFDN